jgi:hypothetical protein
MRRPIALLLLALTLAACGTDAPATDGESGIEGIALLGPQCPVERADSPCPDQPYPDAEIEIRDPNGDVVDTVTTDADGRFRVALEPGAYVLQGAADPSRQFPFSKPVDVTVTQGEFVEVVVPFDTGIR